MSGAAPMNPRQARFREEYRANIEPWYNGLGHVAIVYAIGAAAMYFYLRHIHGPIAWYEWAVIPVVLFISNILEWALHLYVMHRPRKNPIARAIYKRHTLMHHQFFTETNYTIDNIRDFRIVFFPPYTFLAAIGLTIPGALVLGFVISPTAGWLTMCTTTTLYMIYEAFHFSCHVPENALVRHLPFVNTIRRHHAAHHDQTIMMDRNMNLTFPIADWLFGTSDLDRGLLGHLFNGYSTRHLRKDMRRTMKTPKVQPEARTA